MVNEWAGRNQEGWVDGEGIYGISLAHHQQALQHVSVALQMLAEFLFDTASLGGWERAQFSFKEKMSDDLTNIIGQATAEYDVFPLRLLGVHESYL